MADISKVTLPNGKEYDLKDTTARNAANSAVPNTRTVNGKALSSNISLGAGDVGAYTKKETDTKINAAIASAYKYKGSVTADKLPTSGQVVGDVYNITNDSSYGKAGMNVAWTGTTWDALGSNVDLSNYVTTSDSRLSNARPASDVYAWAKAASKPSYSASEISGLGNLATKNSLSAGDVGAVSKSGDTMTGNLTAPSFQTGTGDANYFQCKKFRGEGNASTYYHAIDLGYANHDKVDFHEYGGEWNFLKNTGGASSTGVAVGSIKYGKGWVGKVNGYDIGMSVPAGSKLTDTVYDDSGVRKLITAKQDILTFDDTPTENSVNPVTSGGVKAYVDKNAGGSSGSTDWTEAASAVTTEDSYFVSLDIPTTPKELFINMFLRINNAENSLGSGIADGKIEFNQSGINSNNIYAGKLFQCHASSAWSTFLHIMLVDGIPYLYGRCFGGIITETRGQKFDKVNKIIISTIKSDYLIKSGAIIRIYTR